MSSDGSETAANVKLETLQPRTRGRTHPRALPGEAAVSAHEIVNRVYAALERDRRINLHRHPISVSVGADGILILEGEAESVAAKKLALRIACAAAPELTGAADRLRVARAEPMSDGEIRDRVRDSLIGESSFADCGLRVRCDRGATVTVSEPAGYPPANIEVVVDDGVVTLSGRVPSLSHKRLAGVLTWWVPGTRDVINDLEVWPPEEDNDDEITSAVILALGKDPLVDADQVHVLTRDRAVALSGVVAGAKQKEAAEDDAWCVFGVNEVMNRLAVLH